MTISSAQFDEVKWHEKYMVAYWYTLRFVQNFVSNKHIKKSGCLKNWLSSKNRGGLLELLSIWWIQHLMKNLKVELDHEDTNVPLGCVVLIRIYCKFLLYDLIFKLHGNFFLRRH